MGPNHDSWIALITAGSTFLTAVSAPDPRRSRFRLDLMAGWYLDRA
jgi:hypothetical protein